MKENLKTVNIDVKGFQDLCDRIRELEEENEFLKAEHKKQRRMINGLKLNNSRLTTERNTAIEELDNLKSMNMYEFANNYCSTEQQEAAGRQLAKELLGGN